VGKLLPNFDCVKTACEHDAGFFLAQRTSPPETQRLARDDPAEALAELS